MTVSDIGGLTESQRMPLLP